MVKQKLEFHIDTLQMQEFLYEIKLKYGYDFSNYKLNTLKRRVALHAMGLKANSFEVYAKMVLESIENFTQMFKYFSIYATDFNLKALKKAKKGTYSLKKLEEAKGNYEKFGGKRCFEDYIHKNQDEFTIKSYIKKRVLFFDHNLVLDKSMNEFQLIVCKNVLIYFDEELKAKVIKLFDESLCVNGFLNIGKKEYIESSLLKNFSEYSSNKKVYQKCK